VDGGEQAVLFDRLQGVLPLTKPEGTHFLLPWLQKAVVFDIRTRPRSISSVTGTKDLQMVNVTLRVLSRPDVEKLPKIYSVRSAEHPWCHTPLTAPRSNWAKTSTSACCPPSATRCSRLWLRSSTRTSC